MKYTQQLALALVVLVIAAHPTNADDARLSLAAAKGVADAAAAEARRLQAGGAIAVVDEGGHLLYLVRLDDTFPAAATVATEKARTAAIFRRPTSDFENAIRNGRASLLGVGVMTPLQGGIPLVSGGRVIGAVGVSGAASAQQDEDIARAAAGSFARRVTDSGEPVSQLGAERVRAAFARGEPLVENGSYKIHASRRQEPGMAEIHARDTDIIYVLDGTATLVTGGTIVDAHQTAPQETRGARIDGGDVRPLAPGDVIVVPAGTPHWFQQVRGPFLYYVVKVTS